MEAMQGRGADENDEHWQIVWKHAHDFLVYPDNSTLPHNSSLAGGRDGVGVGNPGKFLGEAKEGARKKRGSEMSGLPSCGRVLGFWVGSCGACLAKCSKWNRRALGSVRQRGVDALGVVLGGFGEERRRGIFLKPKRLVFEKLLIKHPVEGQSRKGAGHDLSLCTHGTVWPATGTLSRSTLFLSTQSCLTQFLSPPTPTNNNLLPACFHTTSRKVPGTRPCGENMTSS